MEDKSVRELAERIRRERVVWGMTQEDLAEATGIARDKIAKIETGRRDVGTDELRILARTFDVPVEALLDGPRAVVYHRIEQGRPEAEQARAWFNQCIDNSLFVRRISGANAQ